MPNQKILIGLIGLWIASMVVGPAILCAAQGDEPATVLISGEEEPVNLLSLDQLHEKVLAGEDGYGWIRPAAESRETPGIRFLIWQEVTPEVCSPPPEQRHAVLRV